jgi:hypothetical protein
MLFRLERTPKYRGESVIKAAYRWIEVLAVVPNFAVINRDEEEEGDDTWDSLRILNLYLCRTDQGLRQVEEALVWEAMAKGEYREAK